PRTSNDGTDTTIPPEWIVWQKPTRIGKNGNYLVGVSRYVLTPLKNRNQDSVTETLLKLGFEKVAQPETLLCERLPDAIVTLYQKEIQEGETIKLGKWSLLIY
ncbi:MAG: hypothetical protein LBI18_13715, partial [Planctomycetaceae bacterium]|nr:hypothetical protein [Planctomycetaceae bacterium]